MELELSPFKHRIFLWIFDTLLHSADLPLHDSIGKPGTMCPLQETERRREKKNFTNFLFVLQYNASFLRKTSSLSLSLPFALLALKHFLRYAALKERFSTPPSPSVAVSLILTRVTSRKEEISSHPLVSPYRHSPHSIDPRVKRARLEKGDGIISVGCGLRRTGPPIRGALGLFRWPSPRATSSWRWSKSSVEMCRNADGGCYIIKNRQVMSLLVEGGRELLCKRVLHIFVFFNFLFPRVLFVN